MPQPFGIAQNHTQSTQPIFQKSASRKRSRDDAAINLEPDAPPSPPAIQEEPENEWIYGEGMVLIKAKKGYAPDASTQSGTWLEEKKATDDANRKAHEEMLATTRNAKSQRVYQADAPSPPALSPTSNSPLGSSTDDNSGPIIDDFTLHLGIGWRRISEDEHIQAAARGWARYIENHYPITNAQIRLESKSLESYLVEANEGFFLFGENLRQGRLVSQTVDGMLRNLQQSPPVFEGADILAAVDSPKLEQPAADTEMRLD